MNEEQGDDLSLSESVCAALMAAALLAAAVCMVGCRGEMTTTYTSKPAATACPAGKTCDPCKCEPDCPCAKGKPEACCKKPDAAAASAEVTREEFDKLVALIKTLVPADKPDEEEPETKPTVAIVGIVGPIEASVGRMVRLVATGTATRVTWSPDPEIEKGDNFDIDSDQRRLSFSSPVPGVFTFVIAGSDDKGGLAIHRHVVRVGNPPPVVPDKPPVVTPDPTTRPARATYVYERRQGSPPAQVTAALDKLNRAGVVASALDQNVINGKGQVPVQYAIALEEAKKAGIPCLVVEYSSGAPKVVKAPATEAQVLEAAK